MDHKESGKWKTCIKVKRSLWLWPLRPDRVSVEHAATTLSPIYGCSGQQKLPSDSRVTKQKINVWHVHRCINMSDAFQWLCMVFFPFWLCYLSIFANWHLVTSPQHGSCHGLTKTIRLLLFKQGPLNKTGGWIRRYTYKTSKRKISDFTVL